MLEDLRGATDHDGRPLAVTMRALADEVAAAADLVKGKADGIPAALVRGLDAAGSRPTPPAPGPWCGSGPATGSRSGTSRPCGPRSASPRGARQSEEVGIRSVQPGEPLAARVGRVVALALLDVPEGSADVGVDEASETAEVTLGAPDDYELGRLVVRCEVAALSEGLRARVTTRSDDTVTLRLTTATPG